MRSNAIVIGRIVFQNPAQMFLAQDNDVVQTLAPDRSDQPFGKAILPRRSWCDRLVPNPHGAQSACDDGCAYRKSNPAISMVQSAQDRAADDIPGPLDAARGRGILVQ